MKPRADWRPGLRKYPFGVRAMGAGALWREDVRYEFTAAQIDLIESVADELHGMVRSVVRSVVERKLFASLGIRPDTARMVEASWNDHWAGGRLNERAGGLVGRLTLAYDGRDSLKLLACNYDLPDGLFAASVIQKNWRESQAADADQFNGLHDALVERWEELARGAPGREHLHLTCLTPDPARESELVYLSATAGEAGIPNTLLPIQSIGWDGQRFRGLEGEAISWLGKLYPWEAMVDDAFGLHLRSGGMAVLEPLWRWVPSIHAVLPLLWRAYPRHANLCPAGDAAAGMDDADALVVRTALGLDHAATRVIENGRTVFDGGLDPTAGGTVWVETPQMFQADGVRAVIDAWIVGDKCLGMTVREAEGPWVGPGAAIVPHVFRE